MEGFEGFPSFWPSEALRQLAIFEAEYSRYQAFLTHWGRVPASREAIIEEARFAPHGVLHLLAHKRAKMQP